MAEFTTVLLAVGLLLSFVDLKWGMYAILVVGCVQDPLRKQFAEQPVYITALVLLFAVVTFSGAKLHEGVKPFASIPGWNERMQAPTQVFVGIVILQCIATTFYTGSFVLAGIGLVAYLSPFATLSMASSFALSLARVSTFLWVYVSLSAMMVSGVYLSWLGVDWEILRTVGEPLTIYLEQTGEAKDLPAGFFRAPEVAAWHAAAGFCISVALGLSGRRLGSGALAAVLAIFFAGAVLLTGRRKFLVEMMIYLPVLLLLLVRFRAGSAKFLWASSATTLIGVLLAAVELITGEKTYSLAEASARRDESTLGLELYERVINMTIGAFGYVLDANGFLGSGAGSGSQGAQHFGGGDEIIGLAAEGGLGKILAELGVPGFLAIFWLGASFAAHVWKTLGTLRKGNDPGTQLTLGLTAFVLVNSMVFASAHQVFGDIYVLLLIGSCLGFIVASRTFAGDSQTADSKQTFSPGHASTRLQ